MLWERLLVGGLAVLFCGLIALKRDSHVPHTHAGHDQIVRFEVSVRDLPGYWGPTTATIDWCERNYVISYYLAEFCNTLSNAALVAAGACAAWQAYAYGYEARFIFTGVLIAVVGLGSAAYHGTLQYSAQMWDELPMVWLMLQYIYVQVQMGRAGANKLLAVGLILYGSLWSVIHSLGAFVLLFQVHFGALVLATQYLFARSLQVHKDVLLLPTRDGPTLHPGLQSLRRMVWFMFFFSVAAFGLWVVDQVACEHLHALPGGLPNPQFHAWWHVLNGLACHFAMQGSMALRQSIVSRSAPSTKWCLWSLMAFVVPGRQRGQG
mmetsp:Transcript_107948/g.186180  ORF Transcript_107948/g.186180 Transcript_107948/m.186180 type:complete len:321 (-) Transcript_107948:718-1680(-)